MDWIWEGEGGSGDWEKGARVSWVDEDEREGGESDEGGVGCRWIRAHPTVLIHYPREMVLDQLKRGTPLMILRPFKLVIID